MIKIITFSDSGESLLEFTFNNPEIQYFSETQWVNIISTKQKITLFKNALIAFDTDISNQKIDSSYFSLAESYIQDFYKNYDKTLVISTQLNEPIFIFHGKNITLTSMDKLYFTFEIDNKPLKINNMNWMIITHNEN